MGRKFAALALLVVIGIGALFFELPLDRGLSDEEISTSVSAGRKLFFQNCTLCHDGRDGLPNQDELRTDYSQRELRNALTNPPPGMVPFSGSDKEQIDLILFLTRQ